MEKKGRISMDGAIFGYSQPYERDVIESYVSVLYVVENSSAEKAEIILEMGSYSPGKEGL